MSSPSAMLIPRLCRNSALLRIVLATQLFALVLSLAAPSDNYLEKLGLTSIYLQWVVLSATALLCLWRNALNRLDALPRAFWVVLIFAVCFGVTETVSQGIYGFENFDWSRFWRLFAIQLIVAVVVMQLFSMITLLEQRGRVESEARVQALQSRIRPHFLFNSLNTISELTATEPAKAEEAIDSLSLLFRAGLESDKRFHSLASELNLCERYLGLERWRLDDRLQVDWHVDLKNPPAYDVPKLILQPLIENAVVHGEQEDGRVWVKVDVRETSNDLSIVVENGRSESGSGRSGHGMAVNNIRERLIVLYDDRQTFRVREDDSTYRVLMRFPKRRPAGFN